MSTPSECLLGALTLTACKHLGTNTAVLDADGRLQSWRVCVVGDGHALVDIDDDGLRSINCYAIEAENFDAFDGGVRFKIDPSRLLYSLHVKEGRPPDLALVQETPAEWISAANLTLLSALRKQAPEAIDWTAMGDIVPMLDAFEAHMEAKTARRH